MIFILIIISSLIFSTFLFSVSPVNSENNTTTNSSNKTNSTLLNATLQQDQLATITIQVNPQSVNLGNRLADNSEWSYPDRTDVSVTALDILSTDNVNLYVRATELTHGNATINLSNFKYDGFSNSTLPKTQFTGTDAKVKTWDNTLTVQTVPVNLYLKVPFGTPSGTYTSTITYTLMVE